MKCDWFECEESTITDYPVAVMVLGWSETAYASNGQIKTILLCPTHTQIDSPDHGSITAG
jgi:hypothetical protein